MDAVNIVAVIDANIGMVMFKKFLMNKMEKVQANELEDFLSRMRYMDSSSLGMPVAITSLWAVALKDEFGWDVYYPYVVTAQDEMAVLKTRRQIQRHSVGGESNGRWHPASCKASAFESERSLSPVTRVRG